MEEEVRGVMEDGNGAAREGAREKGACLRWMLGQALQYTHKQTSTLTDNRCDGHVLVLLLSQVHHARSCYIIDASLAQHTNFNPFAA